MKAWKQTIGMGLLSFALFSPAAWAQSGSSNTPWAWMYQKSEIKKQSRWSLGEWLATRDRMRWMDMWLALNSPSPFEFFLKGGASTSGDGNKFQPMYGLGAYAQIVGLEFDRENLSVPTYNARFHLRIFGYNVQNTNLTLHIGGRERQELVKTRTGEVGGSLTLYFAKYFGVFGLYRKYFNAGNRTEGGPFIDFGPLRVFGNWVRDEGTTGWIFGGQLFF